MTQFGNLTLAGLTSGAIYAVVALMLCSLFRVAGILNLAIGDFAMLGALGTDFLARVEGWKTPLAILAVLVFIGIFSYAYDWIVLRAALEGRRAQEAVLVVFFFTLSLSFFIEGAGEHMFGTDVHSAPYLWPGPALIFWGLHLQRAGLLVIVMAVGVGALFAGYLHFSLRGKAMAACGENGLAARIVGIKQRSYRRGTFVAMGILAAIFGIVESPITSFTYNSGGVLGLTGILAAAFAGFTRPGRAVVAGLLVGLIEVYVGGYISTQYQTPILYSFLIAIILIRPQLIGTVNPAGSRA